MPRVKVGQEYKRGPHKGMTKGSAKKEYKVHTISEKTLAKEHAKHEKAEKARSKNVISSYSHHPFYEPTKAKRIK